MSVLPLNLNIPLTSFTFPTPLRVTEVEGRREGGRWKLVELPERTIRAVVLVPDVETLEFISAGDATASAINVMTKAELFITDIKNDGNGEYIEGKQSFVHHQGYKFRVIGSGFTMGNTVYNSYNCLRYLEQEQ